MDAIQKIKAEINRQLEELGMSGSVCVGRSVLLEMRDFVNSLEKESDAPKIKGWVARDEDGILTFCIRKPVRKQNGDFGYWFGGEFLELSKEGFPDLKWKDEPIEVEISIRRV